MPKILWVLAFLIQNNLPKFGDFICLWIKHQVFLDDFDSTWTFLCYTGSGTNLYKNKNRN